ncbi:MAG: hypothetical protein ABI745_02690 [Caldimonas sp.]
MYLVGSGVAKLSIGAVLLVMAPAFAALFIERAGALGPWAA